MHDVVILACHQIFIPIHTAMHWSLAVIMIQLQEIRFYDSLQNDGSIHMKLLQKWIESEYADKNPEKPNCLSWKLVNVENIPIQENGCDCGVFTCMFADFLFDDLPLTGAFSQNDMKDFRLQIASSILRGKIPY